MSITVINQATPKHSPLAWSPKNHQNVLSFNTTNKS